MDAHPEYQYERLSSPTSIRLLTLLPGSGTDPLACRLDEVDTSALPPYEAISYVWGSEDKPSELLIYKGTQVSRLSITDSLRTTFLRFRQPVERVLWVDGVCIDQREESEKGHQIPQMGTIFHGAVKVLIWFGEPSDSAFPVAGLDCILKLYKAGMTMGELSLRSETYTAAQSRLSSSEKWARRDVQEIFINNDLPPADSLGYKAIREILDNPWLQRAWTWQESYLAQDRALCWGSVVIPIVKFQAACEVLNIVELFTESPGLFLPRTWKKSHFMLTRKDFDMFRKDRGSERYQLAYVIRHRRGYDCRLPNDLIYSLIGAAENCPDIKIDYKQPFEALFAETVYKLIIQTQSLTVLQDREYRPNPSSLPSWTPNWREGGSGARRLDEELFAATGSSTPKVKLSKDSKILSIEGLEIDKIIDIKNSAANPGDNWTWAKSRAGKSDNERYTFTGETITRVVFRTSCYDCIRLDKSGKRRFRPEDFGEVRRLKELGGIEWAKLRASLFSKQDGFELVWTEKGYLAKVPSSVKKGDVVTLLMGSSVPFILRPEGSDASSRYLLIGQAYVHGLMDGEGMVGRRKRQHTDDEEPNTSWLNRLHEEPMPFATKTFHLI